MHSGGGRPTRRTLGHGLDEGARARDDVVDQHRLSVGPCGHIRQADLDIAVAAADLLQHGPGRAEAAATSATHCSLSESGPISSGRSTSAAIQRAISGAACTTRVGMR
jgi:hypothetical protein